MIHWSTNPVTGINFWFETEVLSRKEKRKEERKSKFQTWKERNQTKFKW